MVPSILIVDEDMRLRELITNELRAHGYHVRSASGFHEALACLKEHVYDVLLTDANVEGGNGLDLVRVLREASPTTRAVLMREHATARDSQRALDLGAVRFLPKPFETDEMLQAVERAAEYGGGFVASLHGLSLVDMLQMFHQSRRSLTVRVLGDMPAALHLRDGQIIHAECAQQRGEAALGLLLKLPSGSLATGPIEAVEQTIFRPMQMVLLELLTKADEEERDSQVLQKRDLADVIFDSIPPPKPPADINQGGSHVSGERPVVRVPEKRRTVEKIDIACERVVTLVDGGVACGVIDLDSGALLGMHNSRGASVADEDLVAGATVDLFRGPSVARIEAIVREQRGIPEHDEHYLEEIQLTSKYNLHFAKTLKGGRAVILLVTKRSTSLGMGWAQLRAAIPVLERLIP